MARSAVTVCKALLYNTQYSATKDAIDLANDHQISVDGLKDGKLVVFIEEAAGVGVTATIKAGDYSGSSVGDLSCTKVTSGNAVLVLETARFKDTDKLILIDLASTGSATGTITAFHLPG